MVPSDLQDITATTETVLAVIDAEGPDAVSFLGDLVGYGANSNAMVAHIRDRGITIMPDQACMRLRPGSSTSYVLHDNLQRHLADEGQGVVITSFPGSAIHDRSRGLHGNGTNQPPRTPSSDADGAMSGRRTDRKESSRPTTPAMNGTSRAT